MTYVVTEDCIKCKHMDCVEVCPVDCFYEGENMLVIHPDECIDCGVCEPECPPKAIVPDSDPKAGKWLPLNTESDTRRKLLENVRLLLIDWRVPPCSTTSLVPKARSWPACKTPAARVVEPP